jgi:hypothetical protein
MDKRRDLRRSKEIEETALIFYFATKSNYRIASQGIYKRCELTIFFHVLCFNWNGSKSLLSIFT